MNNVSPYPNPHKAIASIAQKYLCGKTRYKDNQNWGNLLDPIKINVCRSLWIIRTWLGKNKWSRAQLAFNELLLSNF
jgi:hypothetical protein